MRYALIGMALIVVAFVFGLPAMFMLRTTRTVDNPELYPAFLAPPPRDQVPTFADLERDLAKRPALRASDRCIDAAYAADEKSSSRSQRRKRMEAYLACYIERLEYKPKSLCDPDVRRELARYTRGYFHLLGLAKKMAKPPPMQQGFIEMDERLRRGTDIKSGFEDGAPDPAIIGSWQRLIDIGAFANGESLPSLLSPEVPAPIVEKLDSIRVPLPLCP